MGRTKAATVAGLSHAAVRTKNILESIRFYTEVLGLEEAFRMNAEDGSLATVFLSPRGSIWNCSRAAPGRESPVPT